MNEVYQEYDLRKAKLVQPSKINQWGKKSISRTSLVAEWIQIHLPKQGTQVQPLVQEDWISRRATKPMHQNH